MKPIVVFTNFWDANILAQDKYLTFCCLKTGEKNKYCFVGLKDYSIYSIALGIPDSSKIPFLKDIFRIDHFCPTYDILMAYKEDKDWDKYKIKYRKLLVNRKEDIDDWINNLSDNKVYILCCWEVTSEKCNCHRKILFDALRSTKIWKDKAIWVYRHGGGKYSRTCPKSIAQNAGIQLLPENITRITMATLADTLAGIEPTMYDDSDDLMVLGDDTVGGLASNLESLASNSFTYSSPSSSMVIVNPPNP
jgi:hypothetical protein